MTRRVAIATAILVCFGALVAFVRAQDAGTRSVLRSVNSLPQEPTLSSPPPSATGESADDDIEADQHSEKADTKSSYPIGDETGSGLSNVTPKRGSSLVDRLKRVRDSQANEHRNRIPQSIGTTFSTREDSEGTTARTVTESLSDQSRPAPLTRTAERRQSPAEGTSRSRSRVARNPIPTAPRSSGETEATTEGAGLAPSRLGESQASPSDSSLIANGPMETSAPASSQVGSLFRSIGPALQVDTIGPSAIVVGKGADFTIALSNLGGVAANNVLVRIELPTWVEVNDTSATAGAAQPQSEARDQRTMLWSVPTVAAESSQQLELKITPTENRPFDLLVDWTIRPISNVAKIEVQQPRLEMALFGPTDVSYGETAVYTIQLTNPGTGQADQVAVEFSYGAKRLPQKTIGSLAPGEQTEINVELTAQQAGEMRVAAAATADGGLRADAAESVLVRRAELVVDVNGSALKFAGGVATYEVRVKNIGNATANEVVADMALPAGAKLIDGEQPESGRLAKNVGTLAPGAERVIGIQCQLTSPGENRFEAHAASGGGLESAGFCVTRVKALADLKLTVNDPRGPTAVGDDALYEVQIENRGTKAARQVNVVAQFSEGVEPIKASGNAAEIVTGQVLFKTIPQLAPGEKLVLKIVARADRPGNHRFRAELTCKDPDTRLIAEESTYYFGDDATLTSQAAGDRLAR